MWLGVTLGLHALCLFLCSIGNNTGKLQASVKSEADSTFLRARPGCPNTTSGDKGIGLLTSSGTSNEKLFRLAFPALIINCTVTATSVKNHP